jgi:glucose/arabinose dehydrogenase
LSVFAEGLEGVRVIAFDPGGTMLASMPSSGKVVALPDVDGNGRADRVIEVVSNLVRPHGLAFSQDSPGRLYIAETNRVTAYDYDPGKLQVGASGKVIDLPGGGRHFTRSLIFMPPPEEDKLLISVGSSCDACKEEDWRRAKILTINKDGGQLTTFASGLRNAVFMTVNPQTQEIWATGMGRDHLGDNLPPDEINIIHQGNDYGWPYCYGNNVPDPRFLDQDEVAGACQGKTPPFVEIPAHSAPLGLAFSPARNWPEKYRNNLLVAYHGSWNRSIPTGYKVVLFRFDTQGKYLGREDFISGWLQNRKTSMGRPVDIKIMAKDLIYISDDKAGVIYRLARKRSP